MVQPRCYPSSPASLTEWAGGISPQPLTDPYVSLSTHTARVIQRRPTMCCIQIEGFFPLPVDHNESIMNRMTHPLAPPALPSFTATTKRSAAGVSPDVFGLKVLSTCTCHLAPRFPRFALEPVSRSCRLYTGCRLSSKQAPLRLIPRTSNFRSLAILALASG
jgi:hypothetical protein